jgi:hypothetical protein
MEVKRKKFIMYVIFLVIYFLLGALIYFGIKKFYNPVDDSSKMVIDAIDITDSDGIEHALKNNNNEYALIYGTFKTDDPIYNAYYHDYFSYYNESKIDTSTIPETIIGGELKKSSKFSIFDMNVKGLTFDIINDSVYGTIKDIKNKNIIYEYITKKSSYQGTMLCKIVNDSIECIKFYEYKNIDMVKDLYKHDNSSTEIGFLLIWGLLLFILIINLEPDIELDDNR